MNAGTPFSLPPRPNQVRARILVAGVGNVLCSDDGVGVHAVWELQKQPIPGVTIADLGTAVLHGLRFLEEADRVLVIDAARGGQPPGTLYLFDVADEAAPQMLVTVHAMGLREAVRLLPPGMPRPAITVLGVEPATLDYGLELSPGLQAALPHVVALARETVRSWLNDGKGAATRLAEMEPVCV